MRRCHGPMGEAEWLEFRKNYVTATQACAVQGAHPYTPREELLLNKQGIGRAFVNNRFTVLGSASESMVAGLAAQVLACPTRLVRYPNPTKKFMVTNDEYPLMSATPDALVRVPHSWHEDALQGAFGIFLSRGSGRWLAPLKRALGARKGQTGILELKTAYSDRSVAKWYAGPPKHYWSQVQVQLGVCGYEWGILFGMLPRATLVAHFIEKDYLYLDRIANDVVEFMREVGEHDQTQ